MEFLTRKAEKMRRYLRWRYASAERVPLWWHIGRPNFGDDLNPLLFEFAIGAGCRFETDRNAAHILGMGSILEKASASSIICGSGFLNPPLRPVPVAGKVLAVRGQLSRSALDTDDDVVLGDPAVLVSEMFTTIEPKTYRFGLIPHVRSVARWRQRNGKQIRLIDPAASPFDVVRDIARCEVVLSQSLHGLIVADALNIPNVWIAPSAEMVGGRFKFDDYFSTIGSPKDMLPESSELFTEPWRFDTSIGHFRYSKTQYRDSLAGAARWLPMPGDT